MCVWDALGSAVVQAITSAAPPPPFSVGSDALGRDPWGEHLCLPNLTDLTFGRRSGFRVGAELPRDGLSPLQKSCWVFRNTKERFNHVVAGRIWHCSVCTAPPFWANCAMLHFTKAAGRLPQHDCSHGSYTLLPGILLEFFSPLVHFPVAEFQWALTL